MKITRCTLGKSIFKKSAGVDHMSVDVSNTISCFYTSTMEYLQMLQAPQSRFRLKLQGIAQYLWNFLPRAKLGAKIQYSRTVFIRLCTCVQNTSIFLIETLVHYEDKLLSWYSFFLYVNMIHESERCTSIFVKINAISLNSNLHLNKVNSNLLNMKNGK